MGRLRAATLVALFAALLILPPVGQRLIVTGDEARFVLLARDMLQRGTWFDARVRDQRYRNKPPLYPWSIKLLSVPAGRVSETAAHLPIAVAAIATVFFTTLLGQRLFARRAGVWAGLVLATTYGFFVQSQTLLPDMIVVAFWVAALYAFWKSVLEPPGTGALTAFYVAVALGVFAKGPMGLVPLLIAAGWLVTEEGWRGLRRLWAPAGIVGFVVITAVWVLPFVTSGRRTFARGVLWEDWLAWYLGGPSWENILNYVAEAARGLMPWTTLMVLPLLCVRREWRTPSFRFAFLAWAIPFFVMMLSQNHRTRYLLPSYVGAALLVAWWADSRGALRSRAATAVAWLSPVAAAAGIAALAHPWLDPDERALAGGLWWKALIFLSGTLVLTLLAWYGLRAGRATLLVPAMAGVMAVLLAAGIWLYNDWVTRSQDYRALAATIERHAQGGEVRAFGGRFFMVDVYLGRALGPIRSVEEFNQFTARPDRPVVVLNGRTWNNIQGQIPPNVQTLERRRVRRQMMYVVRLGPPG